MSAHYSSEIIHTHYARSVAEIVERLNNYDPAGDAQADEGLAAVAVPPLPAEALPLPQPPHRPRGRPSYARGPQAERRSYRILRTTSALLARTTPALKSRTLIRSLRTPTKRRKLRKLWEEDSRTKYDSKYADPLTSLSFLNRRHQVPTH